MPGRNITYTVTIIFAVILGLANSGLHPVSSNAGYTGAPGDSNCASCHTGSNAGIDGNINISGLPSAIVANQTYRITVTITNPNGVAGKAGFQLIALTGTNTNAGTMENNSQGTEIRTVFGGKKYFGHSPALSFPESKELIFAVDWKAPANTGINPVVKFYACGVIANGDNSTGNDRVVLSIRQISIQNSAPLSVNISNVTSTSCSDSSDGSASITATGGSGQYTYLWSNGQTSEKNSSLSAGSASITITDSNGLSTTASVNIPSPPPLMVTTSGTTVCDSMSNGKLSVVTSGGTGGYKFLWSSGSTVSNVSDLAPGKYSITVTDQNQCVKIADATIKTFPALTIIENTFNASCYGEKKGIISLKVSGGMPGYNYLWSNNKTEPELKDLGAGIYTITITDNSLCSKVRSFEITEPKAITNNIIAQKDVTCFGQKNGIVTIEASGGNPEYLFSWSNGSSNSGKSSSLTNLEAGKYTLTVTDLLDCTATTEIVILQPPLLKVEGSIINVSCYGKDDGSISINTDNNSSMFSYLWSDGSTLSRILKLSAGKYAVTVTDTLIGCSTNKSFELNQPLQLSVMSTNKTDVTCYGGQNGKVNISINGGSGSPRFLWSTGSMESFAEGLSAGDYTYSVTDENGCTLSGQVLILQPSQIKIARDSIRNSTCAEIGDGYLAVSVSNTAGTFKINWSNGKNSLVNTNLFAGLYKITVTDQNQCVQTDSFSVKSNPGFFIELSTLEDVKCNGDSSGFAFILPNESLRYEWSNGSFGPTLNRVPAGNYSVTATDRTGCKSIPVHFKILQPPKIKAELIASDSLICAGANDGYLKLKIQGGTDSLSYKWSNGRTSLDLDSLIPGKYTITIVDKNECIVSFMYKISTTDSIKIANKKIVDVNCLASANAEIHLTVKGGISPLTYFWSKPGLQGNSITGLTKGNYSLTITDAVKCSIVDSFTILQLDSLSVSPKIINETIAGKKDGKVSLDISGGKGPYSVFWSNGYIGNNIENFAPGYYTYIVEDINKCQKNGYVIVGGGLCLLSATATTKPATCFNSYDGKIELTINGAFSKYMIELSSESGPVILPVDSLPPGKYAVAVIDSLDCLALIFQVEVSTLNPPIIIENIIKNGPSSSILKNGSMEAIAKGGKTPLKYEWYKDGQKIGNDKKIEGVSIGIYTLIVTDSAGCALKVNSIFLQIASSNYDEVLAGSINIFPNPASEYLNIENNSGSPLELVSIFNIHGQLVYYQKVKNNAEDLKIFTNQFNNSDSGIFFVKMQIAGKSITRKIILTN